MALAVKSAVRRKLKGMRIAGDFWTALDKHLGWELEQAASRAKANRRKTVRGHDL